jgi:hypothetical protein
VPTVARCHHAVWGVTFVQVRTRSAHPFLAFLGVRWMPRSAHTAGAAAPEGCRDGLVANAVLGALIALGIGQTASLERTTVTNTGSSPAYHVLFTPSRARALPTRSRASSGRRSLALVGLRALRRARRIVGGRPLVLASAVAQALQIVMVSATRTATTSSLTWVEVATACAVFLALALALGDPRSRGRRSWSPGCCGRLRVPGPGGAAARQRHPHRGPLETVRRALQLPVAETGSARSAGPGARSSSADRPCEPAAAATLRRLVRRPAPEPGPRSPG